MKTMRLLLAAAMVGGLSGCATVPPNQADSMSSDPGYFLSMKQKGQLIGKGRIQDAQGIWYDVWIVPGYVEPARRTATYLQRTGSDFAEYVQSKKYHDLADASGDSFEWAYDDCLTDFTVKGVPRAWDRYWSAAHRRSSQRVFGWWLAYPWAFLESTVDTVVRVPAGLVGTALGTAWGAAVVPAYYAVNSAAKGTWHLAVDSIALPAVACTWNTVIAPPLAVVGQKPAPARADGFWLKQLGASEVRPAPVVETPIGSKDVEVLAAWSRVLLTASQPYEDRLQTLRHQTREELDAISRKSLQAETGIKNEEQGVLRAVIVDPSQQGTLDYLRSHGFDSRRISRATTDLRRYLKDQEKLSPAQINRALNLLTQYPPTAVAPQPPVRPKTDPVEHSIEVIKDLK